MYKYQEEVVENIDDAVYKIEQMTEEHYRVHIGFRETNDWDEPNIPIFVEVNGNFRFTQRTNMDECYDHYSKCELYNHNRIKLLEDVFLELNKLLDKVIQDNKKREQFYEQLNIELKAFNKSLATL